MERRPFFATVVGVITGWRFGGRNEVFDTRADLSYSSLVLALAKLGRVRGGRQVVLAVTPEDYFVAIELSNGRGGPILTVDERRRMPDNGAWYVENGTHRVWGSKGGW